MRTKVLSAVAVLCLVSALAVSSCVSAEERAILAGDSFSVEVELSMLGFLTYSWSSDEPLSFAITDPSGNQFPYGTNTTSGDSTLPLWSSGTYTLTWYNYGSSTSHLSFDLSEPFSEVDVIEETMWTLTLIGIIIAVGLVAVVVIVVIVIVMSDKGKKSAPPAGGPSPLAAQALATGHCPTCGVQIDTSASFCAKCGTRFK